MSTPIESLMLKLPPSDLFNIETRSFGYSSFYYDIHANQTSWPIKPYEVSFECHQAVLNEISTRPSNFGYGAGVALRTGFDAVRRRFKAFYAKVFGSSDVCAPEDEAEETTRSAIEACFDATTELQESLITLERAELAQHECLVRSGSTPREARELQLAQQPIGYRPHFEHFESVSSAYYTDRFSRLCPKETAERREAAIVAESAERAQRHAC